MSRISLGQNDKATLAKTGGVNADPTRNARGGLIKTSGVEKPKIGATGTQTKPQTGVMNAVIAPASTKKATAPIVATADLAEKDLENKKTQFNQLQEDVVNHAPSTGLKNLSIENTPKEPQVPKTIDQQLSEAMGNIGLDTPEKSPEQLKLEETDAKRERLEIDRDTQANAATARLNKIASGVYPLNPSEKALLASTEQAFQSVIAAQQLANTAYTGQMKELAAQTGMDLSAPGQAVGLAFQAISVGNAKVADLNAKMASSLAELSMGFQKQDYDMVQGAWNATAKNFEERSKALKDMHDEMTVAVAEQKKETKNKLVTVLLANGVTEPTEILQKLQENGIVADPTEISDLSNKFNKDRNEARRQAYDIAIKNGAPPEVVAAITNAKTEGEAYAAIGDYGVNALDQEYKRASIANIYSEIEKRNAEIDDLGEEEQFDPAQVVAYAQQYAATGKIPTGIPKGMFGAVSQYAKEIPKQQGQLIDVTTGTSPDAADTTTSAFSAAYSAVELAKQLKELDKERYHGFISGSLGKITGSEDQSRYLDLREQIVDLLARARSGAALTTTEEARYSDMLPGRLSNTLGTGVDPQVRIDNFIKAISDDIKYKASSKGWAINGLSKVKVDTGNGEEEHTVGDLLQRPDGATARVNADGTMTLQ